jgi:hypothetical protein
MRQHFGVGTSYGSWLGLTTLAYGWDVTRRTLAFSGEGGGVLLHPTFRTCESVPPAPPLTPCGERTDDQDMFVDYADLKMETPNFPLC